MKLNVTYFSVCAFICMIVFGCSSEEFDLTESKNEAVVNVDQAGSLSFVYKGTTYSSLLDLSDSDALFSDSSIEAIYRSILEKPGVVISVKSEHLWELYDDEDEYYSNSTKSLTTKSTTRYYEPEAYQSHVWMYEHDNLSGQLVEWSASNLEQGDCVDAIDFTRIGFDDKLSSFQINNMAYYYDLRAYFRADNVGTGPYDKCVVVIVQPRATFVTLSISKTFGSKKDNQASAVTFYIQDAVNPVVPENEYVVDYISYYNTDAFSTRYSVILDEKYISNNSNQTKSFPVSFNGKLTQEAYFSKTDPSISENEIAATPIGIPSITDGVIYLDRLTSNDWNFKLSQNQIREIPVYKATEIWLSSWKFDFAQLKCREHRATISYTAHLRKKATDIRRDLDGKLEVVIQTNPYIGLKSEISFMQ